MHQSLYLHHLSNLSLLSLSLGISGILLHVYFTIIISHRLKAIYDIMRMIRSHIWSVDIKSNGMLKFQTN